MRQESRYLIYKTSRDWTVNQRKRSEVLIENNPLLKEVHQLTVEFRNIYKNTLKTNAESFNAKIKNFKTNHKGVIETKFFFFDLKTYSIKCNNPQ